MRKCIFVIMVLLWSNCVFSLGWYDQVQEKGIVLFSDLYERKSSFVSTLMYLDFKKSEKFEIAKGDNISDYSVSPSSSKVLYLDEGGYKVYSLNGKKNLYSYPSPNAYLRFIDETTIAGIDYSARKIVVINILDGERREYPYAGQHLWGVALDDSCKCPSFELSDTPYGNHYVVYEKNGAVVKGSSGYITKDLPKGITAYFREGDTDDSPVHFVLKRQGKEVVYYTSGPLKRDMLLWGAGTLRILQNYALIDLASFDLMYPTANLWLDMRKNSPLIMDVAYNEKGYVLKWNMDKQLFEVEDIRTGKTIKTYKKFW